MDAQVCGGDGGSDDVPPVRGSIESIEPHDKASIIAILMHGIELQSARHSSMFVPVH